MFPSCPGALRRALTETDHFNSWLHVTLAHDRKAQVLTRGTFRVALGDALAVIFDQDGEPRLTLVTNQHPNRLRIGMLARVGEHTWPLV